LKRVIQKRLENPLAMEILKGNFSDGDRVLVDREGDELVFRREMEEPRLRSAG
jgi:ATP-dependent Clp protease ATP-binding subunit ClpB